MKNYLRKPIMLASASLTLGLTGCFEMTEPATNNTPAPTPSLDIVETAQIDDRFETLIEAVIEANLVDTLQSPGPFTIFAPTNDAFGLYLEANEIEAGDLLAAENLNDILTYHFLASSTTLEGLAGNSIATVNGAKVGISMNGTDLYINNAKVIVADINASNGIIHALDRVLNLPEAAPSNTNDYGAFPCGIDSALPTMLEIASADDRFSSFITAVLEADDTVLTTLSSAGPLTLFAPTNDAFAKVDATALTNLLANTSALTNVLLNHVYTGGAVDAVTAYSLNGTSPDAAGDSNLSILIEPASRNLTVTGSAVVDTDIYACNGIIHVIDTVIL